MKPENIIECMSNFDGSALDGHLLKLLSAVSHLLDKLRAITGDPLFVKRGRGIVPTARAEALAQPARELLRQMQLFAQGAAFDPAAWQTELTIAANDFQRDLLLPALAARLRTAAPGITLRIVPSGAPSAELLRSDACQLVISPRPPDGTDIVQKRLFEDQYRVFYDAAVRSAPATEADYLAADHATVAYEAHRGLDLDRQLLARGRASPRCRPLCGVRHCSPRRLRCWPARRWRAWPARRCRWCARPCRCT
jgi:DNA-binding transcriptional LysR family regulator